MLSFAQDPGLTRWEVYPKPTFLASEANVLFFRRTVLPPSGLDVCRATWKGGAGTSTSVPQQVLGVADPMGNHRGEKGRLPPFQRAGRRDSVVLLPLVWSAHVGVCVHTPPNMKRTLGKCS